MNPFMSLRTRILLSVIGTVLVIGVALMIVVRTTIRSALLGEFRDRAISLVKHTALQSLNPLLTDNTFAVEMLFIDMKNSEKDIVYIFITEPHENRVVAHTFDTEIATELKNANVPAITAPYSVKHLLYDGQSVLDIAVPLYEGKIGTLRMGFSEQAITDSVRSITAKITYFLAGVTALMGLLTAYLSRTIVRPITELTEATRDMIDGRFDRQVSIRRIDEIGRLAVTFNTMVESRKQIEERLKFSEEKYRALVEATEDSIYLVDRDYCYVFMNRQHLNRMGFSGEDFIGRSYADFHTPEETETFTSIVSQVFQTGESSRHEHFSNRDNRFFLRTFSPMRSDDGSILAVNVVSKDITDLKHLQDKLMSLSLTDELTGLYNRRGFFTLVDQQLKLANRNKQRIYMIYADLDNLKEINDVHGHPNGDQALIDIARKFQETFRDSDIIARIGGDEFVVIPAGITEETVRSMNERLQRCVDRFNTQKVRPYSLSVSIGIAIYDPDAPVSVDELLRAADQSMYEIKRSKQRTR